MEKEQAIDYIENLKEGDFLTVNIPIFANNTAQITAMYVGKDKNGGYRFLDNGSFILTKEFLERGKVTIDKEYNSDIAIDIHTKFKMEQEIKRQKQKSNRDYR